mgnify:CR=1 FL=1
MKIQIYEFTFNRNKINSCRTLKYNFLGSFWKKRSHDSKKVDDNLEENGIWNFMGNAHVTYHK